MMKISTLLWLPDIIDKLISKHDVSVDEVEEIFAYGPLFRRGPRGRHRGENLYYAYGQTVTGRYLFVVFILKLDRRALILSARDMENDERRLYLRG